MIKIFYHTTIVVNAQNIFIQTGVLITYKSSDAIISITCTDKWLIALVHVLLSQTHTRLNIAYILKHKRQPRAVC